MQRGAPATVALHDAATAGSHKRHACGIAHAASPSLTVTAAAAHLFLRRIPTATKPSRHGPAAHMKAFAFGLCFH